MKKMIATASAMMMSASLFAAEVSFNELSATEGTALVVVKQVVGNDQDGEPRFLFEDAAGAVLQVWELAQIDEIMNAHQIDQEGEYCNLHVILDGEAFVISNDKVQTVSLEQGMGGTVLRLSGRLQVSRNFVGTDTDFRVIDTATRMASGTCSGFKG